VYTLGVAGNLERLEEAQEGAGGHRPQLKLTRQASLSQRQRVEDGVQTADRHGVAGTE
jgi:hypothetical protein